MFSQINCLNAALIEGIVSDRISGGLLEGVQLRLEDERNERMQYISFSDSLGRYTFVDVNPGIYDLVAVKDSFYADVVFGVELMDNSRSTVDLQLIGINRDWRGDYCFNIGTVLVVSEEGELISDEHYSSLKLNEGDIEHMQAVSLGDVLDLLPGVETPQGQGLVSAQRAAVRSTMAEGVEGQINTYSTALVIDGIELGSAAGLRNSSAYAGTDLREIPVENLQGIEVISGAAPVEYGNYSGGILDMKKRRPRNRQELKAKLNPDTGNMSWIGGWFRGDLRSEFYLDYAYSQRDLRLQGDEYHRIHGAARIENTINADIEHRFAGNYTRILNNEAPYGPLKIRDYDQGYRLQLSDRFIWKSATDAEQELSMHIQQRRRDEHHERWVAEQKVLSRDTVFTGMNARGEEIRVDSSITVVLPGFIGSYDIVGNEWKGGLKYLRRKDVDAGSFRIARKIGVVVNYEKNTGEGFVVDPEYSYYGQYSGKRSYSFDTYPGMLGSAIYGDVELFLLPNEALRIYSGLRLDLYGLKAGDKGIQAQQGAVLQPRLSARWKAGSRFTVNISFGRSAMRPSLAHIYHSPEINEFIRDSLEVIEIFKQENRELKAWSSDQSELRVAYDINGKWTLQAVLYRNISREIPALRTYPQGFSLRPDTLTSKSWSRYENIAVQQQRGFEVRLISRRLGAFKHQIDLNGRESNRRIAREIYSDRYVTPFESPWYLPPGTFRRKVNFDYRLTAVSDRLAMWFSLDLRMNLMDRSEKHFRTDAYQRSIDGVEREWYQGMVTWYDIYPKETDRVLTLINARVTKSITANSNISIYINNLFDDRGLLTDPHSGNTEEYHRKIFYGLELASSW